MTLRILAFPVLIVLTLAQVACGSAEESPAAAKDATAAPAAAAVTPTAAAPPAITQSGAPPATLATPAPPAVVVPPDPPAFDLSNLDRLPDVYPYLHDELLAQGYTYTPGQGYSGYTPPLGSGLTRADFTEGLRRADARYRAALAALRRDAASQSASAAAPPTQAPTAASSIRVPLAPDGNRIYEDVRILSLSPRPAGSARDRESAEFIAAKLRTAGYEVSFQEFPVQTTAREVSLSTSATGSQGLRSLPMQGSASGKVQAQLVAAGIGRPNDFTSAVSGAAALIERGELLFNDKVANAQAAGAAAAIIFNNQGDVFNGSLSREARIPVIAISQADGRALLAALQSGRVDVELSVGAGGRGVSRNVIAKPPGQECETITGGHYDSVPQAPGASDNGTGTAAVIEIASIMAGKGEMRANCFVLFGAEELGLIGSRYFVNNLDNQARSRIKAMFNYDMVGVGNDGWLFIGDGNLQRQAQTLGARIGVSGAIGQLGNASSDHASFQQAGIPAFMLHRTNDSLLHTPQDTIDRVRPELLEQAAKLGVALLESVNAGS